MLERTWIGALALAAAMSASGFVARAHDETKYPDLKGQWVTPGVSLNSPWIPSNLPGVGSRRH